MYDPVTIAALIRETARAEIVPRFRALAAADIREKGPGDLVTIADIETERQLTRLFQREAPGTVVLGEEAVARDPATLALLAGEAPVWVIDPVDGTANFAAGRPGFAVIVALVERGRVRAGWIYDPLGDVMLMAREGEGAWCEGERQAVARAVPPEQMVGAAYGSTVADIRAARALAESGRVGTVRNLGCSALEYLAIAQGAAQFSLHSRSLPWDHAAGMLIVAKAGGVAAFLDGTPYDPRIPNRPVLAAASEAGWRTVQQVVAPLR